MAVNNPYNSSIPDSSAYSRLFLRDEELQIGLASIMEAAMILKSSARLDADKFGLSPADLSALIAINVQADNVINLTQRLGITKQSLLRTLGTLESKKFITKADDRRDKRRTIISITALGAQTTNQICANMRNALAKAYRNAGADAVFGFDQVLWALIGGQSNKSQKKESK